MAFKEREAEDLLVACKRRCCLCHRFCGSKMELDHADQSANGGSDEIANAIPLCFDCHAEAHAYNDMHTRGRKLKPSELRRHRDAWIELCRTRPEIFINLPLNQDVGPLQPLLDELEFNITAVNDDPQAPFCPLMDEQFTRAVAMGSIAILADELKRSVLEAYAAIGAANHELTGAHKVVSTTGSGASQITRNAHPRLMAARDKARVAHETLLKFVRSDQGAAPA